MSCDPILVMKEEQSRLRELAARVGLIPRPVFRPEIRLPCLFREKPLSELSEWFWSRVSVAGKDDCWEWLGFKDKHGCGSFSGTRASRFAYQMTNGPIAPELDVCHDCDNPSCVNPAHLFSGTRAENMQDAAAKGRMPRGSRHVNAKLNESSIGLILKALSEGKKQRAVAVIYGVTQSNISYIASRKTWRHVV